MNEKNLNVSVILWVNRFIMVCVAAMVFLLPLLLDFYCRKRTLTELDIHAISYGYYCSAIVTELALWKIDCLLRNIRARLVFVPENVRHIRCIQWCCGGVGLICLPAAVIYYPLIFIVIIMAFLCLMVRVVAQIMDTAVSIREENDLTV